MLGDFNDGPESLSVRTVAGELAEPPRGRSADIDAASALDAGVLHHCARGVAVDARHTIIHRGVRQQIDHILVSRSLWRRLEERAGVERGVREGGGDGREDVESDHAAVVASFA